MSFPRTAHYPLDKIKFRCVPPAFHDVVEDTPPESQTIKHANLIHNTQCITEFDPGFSVVFINEIEALLDVMTKGDPNLHKQAIQSVARYRE